MSINVVPSISTFTAARRPGLTKLLDASKTRLCHSLREEHEQSDRDHAIEVAFNVYAAHIGLVRRDRQLLLGRAPRQVSDGCRACVLRGHAASLQRGGHGEVAEPTTQIEHVARKKRQDRLLKGVERKVSLGHLPCELLVKEIYGAIFQYRAHTEQERPQIDWRQLV